jgi:hypothetical protein
MAEMSDSNLQLIAIFNSDVTLEVLMAMKFQLVIF